MKSQYLNNEGGFTYIEVVIAFMIFGLMLVIMLRLSNSVSDVIDAVKDNNKMLHVAEYQMENYKSAIEDMPGFLAATGYVLTSENIDGDGHVINRSIINNDVDGKYTVVIEELMVTRNLKEVKVTILHNQIGMDPLSLSTRMIKNSE